MTTHRCNGSSRFGIEAHEAPLSEFPKQPSRKDGLGVMCTLHWKTYVRSLREARITSTGAAPTDGSKAPTASRTKATQAVGPSADRDVPAVDEMLVAPVDTMPAD